jgi:hypothetical protein
VFLYIEMTGLGISSQLHYYVGSPLWWHYNPHRHLINTTVINSWKLWGHCASCKGQTLNSGEHPDIL